MSQIAEGAPPHLPSSPDVPGPYTPDNLPPGALPPGMRYERGPQTGQTVEQVQAEVAKATASEVPMMEEPESGLVTLPAGLIRSDGFLVKTARVRELSGYDEEKLARVGMTENPAVYVTEMLSLTVEVLGDEAPTKDMLRSLLIGDRDALWIGVRRVTYGTGVEYKLECVQCEAESVVTIDLDEDLTVKLLDDPLVRVFNVELRHGVAEVGLLTGFAQEKLSTNLNRKTQAEINTMMLAHSVRAINGVPVGGEDDARRLSAADRQTIMEFIVDHQPGPELGKEIEVHCATCDAAYPIVLSLPSMFRL